MSFNFAALQAQLAAINNYAGETIVVGGVEYKAIVDASRAGEVLVHGGTELKVSCTAQVSKSQMTTKPAQKTLATVRGNPVKLIEIEEDSVSYRLTFGWAFMI